MALNAREQINGNTPQDLNKMNNNFMSIWKTLFGGLDFSDTNNGLKKKIQTQQIPVQGEGNFDKNFPLYVRFFVPSNTKSITSTSFNFICERYRMDSGVANDGGGKAGVDITMSMGSSNVGVASISSPTVGVSSVSSQTVGVTGASGGDITSRVKMWGNTPYIELAPTSFIYNLASNPNSNIKSSRYGEPSGGFVTSMDDRPTLGVLIMDGMLNGNTPSKYVDFKSFQHEHHIPSHTHNISVQPHSHSISMSPHSHTISLEPHTHSASGSIDLPDHNHKLNEGIQISKQDAQDVNVKVNGTSVATMNSISSNTKNNIDCKDLIKIGEWNTIECTTSNLARLTIYGIIELVMNY